MEKGFGLAHKIKRQLIPTLYLCTISTIFLTKAWFNILSSPLKFKKLLSAKKLTGKSQKFAT